MQINTNKQDVNLYKVMKEGTTGKCCFHSHEEHHSKVKEICLCRCRLPTTAEQLAIWY